jgi:hypothetical protein
MCRQWNIYIAGAFLMVAVTTAGLAMTKLKHMHCMLLTATIGGRHQNYELLPRLRLPCKSSHRDGRATFSSTSFPSAKGNALF